MPRPPVRACVLSAALLLGAGPAAADPPQLPAEGLVAWSEYDLADSHRAFAVAPGGVWAWTSGLASAQTAEQAALAACGRKSGEPCLAYAVDDAVVFDPAAWARLWRPYADAAEAARAPVGTARGQRFPDLALHDPAGRPLALSDLRGKVVLLHFWGSWCPPCLAELPELAKLHAAVADVPDLAFVLLQVREPVAQARRYLVRKGMAMPQYDSGAASRQDEHLALADGGRLPDREAAPLFPTTYVLDKQGLVLFAHRGIVAGLPDYAPLLRDAAGG